jgi:hypothetical protein
VTWGTAQFGVLLSEWPNIKIQRASQNVADDRYKLKPAADLGVGRT